MTQQKYAYTNVITKSIALYFILELPNEYDDTAVWEWTRHGGKFYDIPFTAPTSL